MKIRDMLADVGANGEVLMPVPGALVPRRPRRRRPWVPPQVSVTARLLLDDGPPAPVAAPDGPAPALPPEPDEDSSESASDGSSGDSECESSSLASGDEADLAELDVGAPAAAADVEVSDEALLRASGLADVLHEG